MAGKKGYLKIGVDKDGNAFAWMEEEKVLHQAINNISSYPTYIKNGARVDKTSLEIAFKHIDDIQFNKEGLASYNRASGLVGGHDKPNFMNQTIENGGRIEIQNITRLDHGLELIEYKVVKPDKYERLILGNYFRGGETF